MGDNLYADPGAHPSYTLRLEPLTMMAALATTTNHIGLGATVSTTYGDPFWVRARLRLARPYQRRPRRVERGDDDQPGSGRQFRQGRIPTTPTATRCAEEFLEVVKRLWDGWDDDAIVADRTTGALYRSDEAARDRPCRPSLQGEGPGQHRPQPAGPPDRAPGRRLGARPGAGRAHRRRRLLRGAGHRGIEGRLHVGEEAAAGVRPHA